LPDNPFLIFYRTDRGTIRVPLVSLIQQNQLFACQMVCVTFVELNRRAPLILALAHAASVNCHQPAVTGCTQGLGYVLSPV